jgi:hypothetical protein
MDGGQVKVLGTFCDYANVPKYIKKGEAISHKCHENIQGSEAQFHLFTPLALC